MMSPWGLLLFGAYLPTQKDPRRARIRNVPVDIQIIQRAGVGITDMLVDPAFVQFAEVGLREDGAAFELVTVVLNRYSTSCTGTITGEPVVSKAQSRFLQLRLTERWQSPHSM